MLLWSQPHACGLLSTSRMHMWHTWGANIGTPFAAMGVLVPASDYPRCDNHNIWTRPSAATGHPEMLPLPVRRAGGLQPPLQLQLTQEQRAHIHEGQDIPIDLAYVEQIRVLLDLVQLQPHLHLRAKRRRAGRSAARLTAAATQRHWRRSARALALRYAWCDAGAAVHSRPHTAIHTLQRTAIELASKVCSSGGRVHGRHLRLYCATIFHSKRSARSARKISSIMSAGASDDCTPRCHRRCTPSPAHGSQCVTILSRCVLGRTAGLRLADRACGAHTRFLTLSLSPHPSSPQSIGRGCAPTES